MSAARPPLSKASGEGKKSVSAEGKPSYLVFGNSGGTCFLFRGTVGPVEGLASRGWGGDTWEGLMRSR